jgi:hypothetical protein
MEEDNMKKTMRTIILIVTVIWSLPCYSQSPVYPYLYKVQVALAVSFDSSNNMFFFSYKLFNDQNNNGNIDKFEIDISRANNTISLDTIGLRFAGSGFLERMFRQDFPPRQQRVVPVGFPSVPNKEWDGMLTNQLTASFFADSLEIQPGNSVEGIVIMSKGLPGVKKCTVYPDFEDDLLFPDPNDTTVHYYVPPEDSIRAVVNFYGYTVGPTAPPINFIPTVWFDTLTNYTTQSRIMGWIKDDATENKYLGYFASAKTKLVQQDNVGARNVLLQVLKDIDIDSTVNLTSEAYALICYNTKYLLAQMPILIVKLVNSTGSLLTTGTLQYKDSTWENATNNNDGTFTINTTKKKLSLRMTYAYGTQTKSNVTIGSDTIIFQTKNVSVNLQNSTGAPLDTGIVQYNSGGWKDFGITSNGVATKELLPIKYTFRLTYNDATISKAQNIDSNATVIFQTVPAKVQLQASTGAPLDTGIVEYNSGGWKSFGITSNGIVTKELLPTKYNFRITYNGATVTKSQSLDSNATVVFQTIRAKVQLQTSQGAPLDTGIVEYNSGGWKNFGTTLNGVVTKELLPTKYTFRITYDGATVSKAQSIDSNATVIFQTVKTLVQFNNSKGNPMPAPLGDTGIVQFNSGGWQNYGSTSNGIVTKELLPVKYTFRLTYNGSSVSIAQNVDSNVTVVFSTVLCTVSVTNAAGSLLNNATVSYNAGGWKVIGTTTNGIVTIELLPVKIQFRAAYGSKQQSVTQDVSTNPLIAITLPVQ